MEKTPVRRAAESILEACPGAFLRCDRGEGLYVTNAPHRTNSRTRLQEALETAGFAVEDLDGLWRLTPGEGLVGALETFLSEDEDGMHLDPLRGRDTEAEDFRLLVQGIKRYELRADRPSLEEYERAIRQRAADCLRRHRGGGLLPLCGRLIERIREER